MGALIVSLAAGLVGFGQDPPQTQGGPRLRLSEREWNLGQVWQGEPLRTEIIITNAGDAPLEIMDVISSCGCTTPSKPKSPLAPGESDILSIAYDSVKRPGAVNQKVTLVTNDPYESKPVIRVFGTVSPVYTVEPKDGLIFGRIEGRSSLMRTVEIRNHYTEPMQLALAEAKNDEAFEIKFEPIEPGQRYRLTAKTRSPLSVGRYDCRLKFTTGIARVPEFSITAYGFVPAPVEVQPKVLHVPRNLLVELKRVLRVTYASDYPVQVLEVRATHPAIKTQLMPARAPEKGKAGSYSILVTLPTGDRFTEADEAVIEILTDAADPAYAKLLVPVRVVAQIPTERPDDEGLPDDDESVPE